MKELRDDFVRIERPITRAPSKVGSWLRDSGRRQMNLTGEDTQLPDDFKAVYKDRKSVV